MSGRPFESRRARFAGWQATAGLLGAGHGLPGLGVKLSDATTVTVDPSDGCSSTMDAASSDVYLMGLVIR